jgi:hypothetical protein
MSRKKIALIVIIVIVLFFLVKKKDQTNKTVITDDKKEETTQTETRLECNDYKNLLEGSFGGGEGEAGGLERIVLCDGKLFKEIYVIKGFFKKTYEYYKIEAVPTQDLKIEKFFPGSLSAYRRITADGYTDHDIIIMTLLLKGNSWDEIKNYKNLSTKHQTTTLPIEYSKNK